tara:strand:+ start:929 stop:1327 length:399 start_codon:yes stop_codon:yes gene_type:complete
MPVGFDAALPLEKDDNDGFYGLTKTIKENTRQKIKMLMLTSPGERIMIPDYGVGLKKFLFENTPEFDIFSRIKEQVTTYLPEISIISLQIGKADDKLIAKVGQKNTLSVYFSYLINGINLKDTLKVVETIDA